MRRCLDTPYPGSHFFWKRYAPSSGTSNSRGSGENNGIAVAAAAATAAVNSNSLILHNMSKWKLEQLGTLSFEWLCLLFFPICSLTAHLYGHVSFFFKTISLPISHV
mmetsp:Transcript_13089/g.19373  ORF Transcript_13089/g.19373 Transcript_13089/m.19373 type:complete len:107 (-) Transcript_13089:1493-1813(-)